MLSILLIGWKAARGCRIERKIAIEYGIKILDSDFFEEKETIKRLGGK